MVPAISDILTREVKTIKVPIMTGRQRKGNPLLDRKELMELGDRIITILSHFGYVQLNWEK